MSDEPKILIDSGEVREGLPPYDESVPCPKCGTTKHVRSSFGLAGGGYGPYTICEECAVIITKSEVGFDE